MTSPTVVLVESSDVLPGLLPFQAWDAFATADVVWVRDREAHPATPHLYLAGVDVATLPPAALERTDLDLTRPGDPANRRSAKALMAKAVADGRVVYLLGAGDDGLKSALAGIAAEHDAQLELVFLVQVPAGTEVLRLVEVMQRLRDPDGGCPWDLQQDHASLVPYLIEETYELVDAIERGQDVDLVEELGDVLLQVVFHAQVASDRGAFLIDDVARGIVDKLVRRHPHVFADGDASTPDEVQANWDRLKHDEKARTGPFDGVPAALPGLVLHETLQRKAAKRGIAPPAPASAEQQVRDHLAAAMSAADDDARHAAIGELIGAVVAVARDLEVDPDAAARASAQRFRDRADAVAALASADGLDPAALDGDTVARLWAQVDGVGPR